MSRIPPYHPSQPEPEIPEYDLASVPDEEIDHPTHDETLPQLDLHLYDKEGNVNFPPLIFGAATFGYGIYADPDKVRSTMPLRVVRLALRSGIKAFDTSPWYHPSEIILGNALRSLSSAGQADRESYLLITKVGKFGPEIGDHRYDPSSVTASVERSLKRLGTDYLDVVYLHDVEFALSPPPIPLSDPLSLLPSVLSDASPPTSAEQHILSGIAALRSLQSQGKIRKIGIAGYPLPLLLRLALLALHTTGLPLDLVQTFSHQTLQNSSLSEGYLRAFKERAKVGQVVSAAPLSMGLLTPTQGPEWHPAQSHSALIQAVKEASDLCRERGTNIIDTALRFGYRPLEHGGKRVPVVVGCTDLGQVHQTLRMWKEVNGGSGSATDADVMKNKGEGGSESRKLEEEIGRLFDQRGVRNWSWACPSENQWQQQQAK